MLDINVGTVASVGRVGQPVAVRGPRRRQGNVSGPGELFWVSAVELADIDFLVARTGGHKGNLAVEESVASR